MEEEASCLCCASVNWAFGPNWAGSLAPLVLRMFLPALRSLSLEACLPRAALFLIYEFWVPYASPNLLSSLVSGLLSPVRLVPLLLMLSRSCLVAPAPKAARGSMPATSPDAVPLICMLAGWVSWVWCCTRWSCSYSYRLDSLFNCSFIRGCGLPGPPVLWAGANPEAPFRTRPLPSPAAALALSSRSGSVIWDVAWALVRFSTDI